MNIETTEWISSGEVNRILGHLSHSFYKHLGNGLRRIKFGESTYIYNKADAIKLRDMIPKRKTKAFFKGT